VVFAFHIIFIEHATKNHSWQQITVVQVTVTALLMIFTASVAEKVSVVWSPRVLWGIGITGFLSLALAFAIQAWAQQFTPATHTALIFTLEPVFAWLTSFLFLGERLGGRSGLGAACILAGLLISEEKASAESMGVSPDHAAVPAQHMALCQPEPAPHPSYRPQ
jgi:drug/metabolite transporter (DMT)-like permease